VREAALLIILTNGPTGYDELTRVLTDIHSVEGWASAGPRGSGGSGAWPVRAHRALHAQAPAVGAASARTERSFTAPLSLTDTGVAAALSALLARALRPRHHLGLG